MIFTDSNVLQVGNERADTSGIQIGHDTLDSLGLCQLVKVLRTIPADKLRDQGEADKRIGLGNVLQFSGLEKKHERLKESVCKTTYQFESSLVQVSVLSGKMVHPTLHEILTKDQRHIVLWQQRQDLGEDLETPEFTLCG